MSEKMVTIELSVLDRRMLHELIRSQEDVFYDSQMQLDDPSGYPELTTVKEFNDWADKMISMLGTP